MVKKDANKNEEYEDMNMITEYFERNEEYRNKYGIYTVLLMQCGSFYEVYAYYDSEKDVYKGGPIYEISQICNLSVSAKAQKYKSHKLYMAGFQYYSIEKYVQRLIESKYTVVEYVQEDLMQSNGKKKIRKLKGIYSPGTHLTFDTNTNNGQLSNHIMSIWIHSFRNGIIIGVSLINNFTGQSYLMEHKLSNDPLQSTSFDELDKYMSIYNPKEIILVCPLDLQTFVKSHINHHHMHENVPILTYDTESDIIQHANEQLYRKQILNQYFGEDAITQCAEFSMYELATQSFCVLMHFIEERNPNLCKHIQIPLCTNNSNEMILANHTLQQLNILEDKMGIYNGNNIESSSLHSVHAWTNKCMTTMGKRLFRETITHPTFHTEWLNNEYNTMEKVFCENEKQSFIETIRKRLKPIQDMQKLIRQMTANRLYPSGLEKLYSSLLLTKELLQYFDCMPWMHRYLKVEDWKGNTSNLERFLSYLEERFYMNHCATIHSTSSFDNPILKKGNYAKLDKLYDDFNKNESQLNTIRLYFERQMSPTSKLGEYVKHITTDKTNSHSLQMTIKRCETLQGKIKQQKKDDVKLENEVTFKWSEVCFVPCTTKTQKEIRFPFCEKVCSSLGQFQTQMNELTQEIFFNILREIESEYIELIEKICSMVASLDVLFNKCYIAKKFNYCCPVINDTIQEKSFVEAIGLRHILIEQINTNEIYVSNNISIGNENHINGMLLFGANTSGKTSNMRALGISIVMAQAGMYVPCKSFVYKPYKSLYSRILNQDNLFKGLSTFAVEMSELRVILKYADENSLILGDELCSGTETISALSIMMASLIQLNEKRCSFMFTTHFHEIIHFEELKQMSKIQCYYLEIKFNAEKGSIEYDRILKEGSGPPSYGLEVCESLYMDNRFLEKAYEIRRMYYPEYEGTLSLTKSRYSSKKLKIKCEKCGSLSEEIHHIHPQKDADKNGFIANSFHKNNPANLMSLCEKCHDKIHQNDSQGSDDKISEISNDESILESQVLVTKKVRKIVKRKK